MNESVLKVKSESGKEISINVFDILESETNGKKYIVYTLENENDQALVSVLIENEGNYILGNLESEEEKEMVEQYLISLYNNEEGE